MAWRWSLSVRRCGCACVYWSALVCECVQSAVCRMLNLTTIAGGEGGGHSSLHCLVCLELSPHNPLVDTAHTTPYGSTLVVVLQDKAEQYCESLRLNGLICTIEPSGGGSGGGGGNEPSTS